MSLNIVFWLLMIMAFFYGGWNSWGDRNTLGSWGSTWFLLALLGWKVYPIALS